LSFTAADRVFIANLVDENGWEAACFAMLRRVRLAESESLALRRELYDISGGWRPLMVRVRERLLLVVGTALEQIVSAVKSGDDVEEAVLEAEVALAEWRQLFPKTEGT
jgi:hypothetical protein